VPRRVGGAQGIIRVEALETLYPDRLVEHVERLAHHALRGEVWDKAFRYCRQAGRKASPRSAYREAAVCLEQALVALSHRPEVEQAESYYHAARGAADELGMRPLLAHCHQGLGTLYANTGRREQAHVELVAAIALYRAMDMTFWLPAAEAALSRVGGW
jgi:tetratricopeptide (TPR) repeat protein